MKISRFNTSTVILSSSFLILFLAIVTTYILESNQLYKFTESRNELLSLDSGEYMVWHNVLLTVYIDLRRMLVEGFITNSTFYEFGYNNTRDHLMYIMNTTGFWGLGAFHQERLNMIYQKSEYQELYDINFIERSDLQVLMYEPSKEVWKYTTMTYQSAMRYVEPIKRILLESPDY